MNISQHTNTIISQSDDEFVQHIRIVLKKYKEFFSKNSNVYPWKFTPTEVFNEIMEKEGILAASITPFSLYKVNQIYHDDIENDIRALQYIYIFRANALLESCINLVNKKDYLSAAIIARSLVELCSVALHHAASIDANYKKLVEELPDQGLTKNLVELSYVREILERGIWGTRLPDIVDQNKDIKQFNVIPLLQKIADKEKVEYLQPMYDFLCEATHPNLKGNYQFIHTPEEMNLTNPTHIIIGKNQTGDASSELLERTLGAISWSAKAVIGMDEHFQKALVTKEGMFKQNKDTVH
jgi:hypothetical protein